MALEPSDLLLIILGCKANGFAHAQRRAPCGSVQAWMTAAIRRTETAACSHLIVVGMRKRGQALRLSCARFTIIGKLGTNLRCPSTGWAVSHSYGVVRSCSDPLLKSTC